METEKDKNLADTAPSTQDQSPDQDAHNQTEDEKLDKSPPPSGDASADAVAEPETTETDAKEGDPQEPTETDIPQSCPPPPPDLGKVSEDVDLFISALLTATQNKSDPPDVPDCVEDFTALVDVEIVNYDAIGGPAKWNKMAEGQSSTFMDAVERSSKLMNSLSEFSDESKYASSINRVGSILQRAMSSLEEDLRALLEDSKTPFDLDLSNSNDSKAKQSPSAHAHANQEGADPSTELPESEAGGGGGEESNHYPGYTEEVVSYMNRIVKTMISGGYEPECCQVYYVVRRNAMEECLHKLGFDKFSVDDIHKMQWEALEREVVSWTRTYKECVSTYLSGERKLVQGVFTDYPSISDELFTLLAGAIMIQLQNFPGAVAMTKRSAEKLFKFLDIYETLRDQNAVVEEIFPDIIVEEVKNEATLIRGRLGDAIICIFCELENSIKADTAKTPVPGGAVHPLTRYTMNYLKYACEYKDTLEQVFKEHQKIDRADSATGSDFDVNNRGQSNNQTNNNTTTTTTTNNRNHHGPAKPSPFAAQIIKVMDLLDHNLEVKSKLYKDTALSLIFMMNNGRYILQKIRGDSGINGLMGDTWCRKRSSDLRSYHKNYQRETWGRLLQCLNHDGLNVNGKVVKPVLKEKFKSFNAMFDEIHKTQSTWVVSDEQLQSELRVSISAVVIPAYRSFLARFSSTFTPGRQTEKYIKYQAEDIETYIDELFDGNATPVGRRKQ